ncbi:MAG: response regulator [Limisphaerales bacterium]
MNEEPLKRQMRVLHLEDNEQDQFLVAELLRANGLDCQFTVAKDREEFTAALAAAKYDLIISDFSLPSYDGVSALSLAQEIQPETPYIFFSGTIGEEVAVNSLQNGATDYVLKQRPSRLFPAILRALRNAAERARLRQAEEVIRQQGALLNKAQDAIIVCNMERTIMYWNQGAERVYGWSAAEALGKNVRSILFRDNVPPQLQEATKNLNEGGEWSGELSEFTKDGKVVIVQSRATLIRDESGRPKSLLIINTNITEKKNYEAQLLRSQRMESIGTLAGGIAHDLNNALAPIIIAAQLLKENKNEDERTKFLDMICASANRSAAMVRQILSFARGSKDQAQQIELPHLISEMVKIVRDTFPKSIFINVRMGENLWNISGDATELHQVLLNLCVNARDAMPQGGELTLGAENTLLTPETLPAGTTVPSGSYVLLTVTDTGTGIPPEVLPRIFEQFFTTKTPDKGTGLGLSTVANIVKNHNGFIQLHSEVNKGTKFKIYLPATQSAKVIQPQPQEKILPTGQGELILVMDDEATVRQLVKTTLESYGYQVVTAMSGLDGITTFEENKEKIRLLISDTDMPFMDGLTAIRAMQKIKANFPIIIASGGKAEPGQYQRIDTARLTLLAKPYTVEQLLQTVAKVINP